MEAATGYWFEIILNLIMVIIGIGIGWYLGVHSEREKKMKGGYKNGMGQEKENSKSC